MTSTSVTLENAALARKNIAQCFKKRKEEEKEEEEEKGKVRQAKYEVSDLVRVSQARNVFAKGYESG